MLPSAKTWWAKHVTDDIYTAGRLTEIQIKYAMEVGFNSIVALWKEKEKDNVGKEVLPTTRQEERIIAKVNAPTRRKQFAIVTKDKTKWMTDATLKIFSNLTATLPKPILFHCNNSYQSSFVALLSLLDQGDLDIDGFYTKASTLGFDYFTDPTLQPFVQSIYGNTTIDGDKISHPDLAIPDWYKKYWLLKPVYKDWYISGQFQINHLPMIDTVGFVTIINNRFGVVIKEPINTELTRNDNKVKRRIKMHCSNPRKELNNPSQEEVPLLNINDIIGSTYTGSGRQSRNELLKNRIWPNISRGYISSDSKVNYASRNYLQFGDAIGYNETLERIAIESRPGHPYKYVHTPAGKLWFSTIGDAYCFLTSNKYSVKMKML